MSTTNTPPSGSANGGASTEAVANSVTDAMQQGLKACMAMPQKIMQANLETAGHALDFMNRRMKAQAALLGGIGQVTDASSLAEAQRAFIASLTRDYAEEMTELAALTRRNFAAVSDLARQPAGAAFAPARSS